MQSYFKSLTKSASLSIFITAVLGLCMVFPSNSQVFNGNGGIISDDGIPNQFFCPVTNLITDSLNTAHGLQTVCLNINHSYVADLNVELIAPDGTVVTLFSGVGGGDDNFTNTCCNDTSTIPIAQGTAQFTGVFRPMDHLGNLNNGQNGNGIWILQISDTYPVDQGILLDWNLEFGANAGGPLSIDSTVLPIFLINTFGQTIPQETKITAGLKIIDNGSGQYNHPGDIPNIYNGDIGIEIRGSSSSGYPQKPYGFETRDSLGNNLNVSLLGMPAENDWILLSSYNDKVFMRNSLAFNLFHHLGHYAPRYRLSEVILNNSYKGIYLFTEKVKRDQNRVNIHNLVPGTTAGDWLTGGYILKVDYHDPSNSWMSAYHPFDHPELSVHYCYEFPDAFTITSTQKTYIQGFMNALETALYGPGFADPVSGYRAFVDVPSLIDYFLVNELSRNNDGFKKSMVFFKDRNSVNPRLFSGPVWDFDWAWKNVNECSIFSATDGSGWAYKVNDCNPDNNSPGWAVRLLQDPLFANQLKCKWISLRSTFFDTTYLFQYIDSVHNLVNEAQNRHYQKWPILGINVGTPEVGFQPLTYDGEIAKFKNWITTRLTWLDANMPGTCTSETPDDGNGVSFLRIFPNPATDRAYFEAGLPIQSLIIRNLTGQNVLALDEPGESGSLEITDLEPGCYFVTVYFKDLTRKTLKLILE